MTTHIVTAIFILAFLFISYKSVRIKNYLAGVMLLLCLSYFVFRFIRNFYSEFGGLGKMNTVTIETMRLLENVKNEEVAGVMMSSSVIFGDGFQCAGGLIDSACDLQLNQLLKPRFISKPENMSLLWLMNSKATRLSIQGNLLFVADQKRADPGFWIGWVDRSLVLEIKRMDGVNN